MVDKDDSEGILGVGIDRFQPCKEVLEGVNLSLSFDNLWEKTEVEGIQLERLNNLIMENIF